MFDIEELIERGINKGIDPYRMSKILAGAIEDNKDKIEIFECLYKEVYGNHLCDRYCMKLVECMNHNGEHGKKWTLDQTNDIARKIGISFNESEDDYTQYEFWTAMHMIYYDYGSVLAESGINDNLLVGKMADAYIDDEDSPKGKLVNKFFFVFKNKD